MLTNAAKRSVELSARQQSQSRRRVDASALRLSRDATVRLSEIELRVCFAFSIVCVGSFSLSISFVAGVLFAMHPIHTEAVSGVVGRAEVEYRYVVIGCLWLLGRLKSVLQSFCAICLLVALALYSRAIRITEVRRFVVTHVG